MQEIKLCRPEEAEEIFKIYNDCRNAMRAENIHQWYDDYPSLEVIKEDTEKKELYGYYEQEAGTNKCLGAVAINTYQDEEYKEIDWEDREGNENGRVVVIHRLAVNPNNQNKGIARLLMDFAEDFARKENYSSIRLDSYSENKRAVKFYENRGYKKRGECFFAMRDKPFYCYELSLK